jgi:hypothetical protein
VAREVLKHVYTAERLQPPTSFGAVLGTYGTLWGRARSIQYWRKVVTSGEWARLGVYAVEAYGIFKVSSPPPRSFLKSFFDVLAVRRLGRLLGVGHLWGIKCSSACARTYCRSYHTANNGITIDLIFLLETGLASISLVCFKTYLTQWDPIKLNAPNAQKLAAWNLLDK